MIIVGLGGPKGVGKDTVANYLVENYGFQKVSLAAPIKKLLNDRFGWDMEDWEDRQWKETPSRALGHKAGDMGVQSRQFSPRSWAQWLGTEVGRVIGGRDVWLDLLFDELHSMDVDSRVVITDCRFENEAHYVSDDGGFTIFLNDPARSGEVAEHASEVIKAEWFDYEVQAVREQKGDTFTEIDLIMHLEGVSKVSV